MDETGSSPVAPSEGMPSSGSARCRHFGMCGGCATQDIPYAEQVARKEAYLRGLLGPLCGDVLKSVVPSPSPWHYRNKMEFAFGFEHGELAIGLRRRGMFHGVVNIEECFIMSEAVAPVLSAVRAWAVEKGFPPYHLRRHEGLLRYVVMREGKRTGQILVIIVTAVPPDEAVFVEALEGLGARLRECGVTTLLWSVTDRKADLAVGEIKRTVFGNAWFEEELAGVRFRLSPHAFFQPNVAGMELLISKCGEYLGTGWKMLVDLYCGVGGLTLPLMPRVERAMGVESEPAAVEDAGINAKLVGRDNVHFLAEDSLAFLRRFSNYSFLGDRWAVLLDPPRAGMHPKMAYQLERVAPPLIIYVSCNPKMLAGDLQSLSHTYRVEEAIPYDFFPHTPHVEVLVKLVRK